MLRYGRSPLPWTGGPCSPHVPRRPVGRTWAETDGRSPFNASAARAKGLWPGARFLAHAGKAFEEAVFGPCTLRRQALRVREGDGAVADRFWLSPGVPYPMLP